MKLKPVYVYLGVFILFIAAVVYFSSTTKNSNKSVDINSQAQMPDDDIHGKMKSQGNGDMPSRENLMAGAVEKINNLKSDYEKNPNDTLKIRSYADVLIAHKPEEALKLYEKILKVDPKRIDILLQMTYMTFNQGDVKKAEEFNNRALTLDPNNLIARFNTAGLAQANGDEKKAKLIWKELAAKNSDTEVGRIASELLKQMDIAASAKSK
ncbi:MAG: hypothetical protein CVV24_14540 [Ignavibacteriae bacterium HGW-Ignavibacteriae-3]|nr:MAG: hypothetical protein CVV24_14540 [Ignavibacteriae bacterium HGW-Ignavibacteriae-3]